MGTSMTTIMTSVDKKIHIPFYRPEPEGIFPLLFLPLEVRLQIYEYVILSSPAKNTHLAPSSSYPPATYPAKTKSPVSISSASFFCAISESYLAVKDQPAPFPAAPKSSYSPALQGHGCGQIPSALLRTCKQLYNETRTIPWQKNEYMFINWFCSGVYASRAFLRALKPWQRANMRFARVEVLKRDLEDTWVATMVGGRPGSGEWKDLCSLWSPDPETGEGGLWGLRLGIKGRVGGTTIGEAVDGSGGAMIDVSLTQYRDAAMAGSEALKNKLERGILDVDEAWIVDGLGQMKALRWLEVDIEDEEVPGEEKIRFCEKLTLKLSEISARRIEVISVKRKVKNIEPVKRVILPL